MALLPPHWVIWGQVSSFQPCPSAPHSGPQFPTCTLKTGRLETTSPWQDGRAALLSSSQLPLAPSLCGRRGLDVVVAKVRQSIHR